MAKGFEELEVYRLAETLADQVWGMVQKRGMFEKRSIGGQVVRAADSIGANIAEGTGRGTYKDNRYFARIARGSLYETRHFLRRAFQRKLVSSNQIDELQPVVRLLGPKLNAYIKAIGTIQKVRETKTASSNQ